MCYGTEGRTKRRRSIVACNQLAGSIHFKFRDIKVRGPILTHAYIFD